MFSGSAIATFREAEGLTLILPRAHAEEHGLACEFPCRLITLGAYTCLDAIGILAKVTAALAEAGIAVNAVSAFHHDHLFVPLERAERALSVVRELSL